MSVGGAIQIVFLLMLACLLILAIGIFAVLNTVAKLSFSMPVMTWMSLQEIQDLKCAGDIVTMSALLVLCRTKKVEVDSLVVELNLEEGVATVSPDQVVQRMREEEEIDVNAIRFDEMHLFRYRLLMRPPRRRRKIKPEKRSSDFGELAPA